MRVPFLFAPMLLLALPAAASTWSPRGEPLCTQPGSQGFERIVSDGSGGLIATWVDWRSGERKVYVERLDASGASAWTTDGVAVSNAINAQTHPGLVTDGSGGAIVFWEDGRVGTIPDVYAQRFDASGTPLWMTDGTPVCTAAKSQLRIKGVGDGAGGAFLAWDDSRYTSFDIFVQKLDALGAPQWAPDGVPLSILSGNQSVQGLVLDGAGGVIVVWYDPRSPGRILAQRIDATGTLLWDPNGVVVADPSNFLPLVAVVPDGAGGVIVAWDDGQSGVSGFVTLQRLDPGGTPLWGAGGVQVTTTGSNPSLAARSAGGAYLAWRDYRDATTEIFARILDGSGATVGPTDDILVLGRPTFTGDVAVGEKPGGGAWIAWQDYFVDSDIRLQLLGPTGTVLWATDGVPVAMGIGDMAAAGSGEDPLLAWYDRRDEDDGDLFALRVDLADPPVVHTVISTGDAGAGTLRQAIVDANSAPGANHVIFFDLAAPGPQVIQPLSPLPDLLVPTLVDGYSQAGSAPNSAFAGNACNGVIQVEIDGASAGATDGLGIGAADCVVRGIAVHGFSGNGLRFDAGSGGSTLYGAYVGTDATGTGGAANGGHGVEVLATGRVYLGGTSYSSRMVVAGNGGAGIRSTGPVRVSSAYVGLDAALGADGNGEDGIRIDGTAQGVRLGDLSSVSMPATAHPAEGNISAYNAGAGVRIGETVGPAFHLGGNALFENGGLGIDTAEPGPNGASAATSFVPAPTVSSAFLNAPNSVSVSGNATGPPGATVALHFFASDDCDPSGAGEGARFIDDRTVVLDGAGAAAYSFTLDSPTIGTRSSYPGDVVSAITIVDGGGVSEFSGCAVIDNTPAGTGIVVSLDDKSDTYAAATLTFDEVTSGGATSLETTDTAPPIPAGFQIGDPPLFYDISSTAAFTTVEVCITYDPSTLGVPETDLRLLHYDTGAASWVDITTTLDEVGNTICGTTDHLSPFALAQSTMTGVGDPDHVTGRIRFGTGRPNPTRGTVAFTLEVPRAMPVTIRVFDLAGRTVRTLAAGWTWEPGSHEVVWDGRDAAGRNVPSGLYFLRFQAEGVKVERRIVRLD